MASMFNEAVAYALSCVNLPDLKLKNKQEEALNHLFEGRDVFAWFPTGYGKSPTKMLRLTIIFIYWKVQSLT